ncbi:uncharacterized protein MKK02DRAFT_29318 [Dioszegia hungarica]|uniref:F-box domain-containing protein n=1 Tax=Dioszegia hungarica TaxID=4972 RepID=A0AA38HDN4_9TREE|nr:uncharacterized protein MKK02DRAFT_29318 [Dioszegia hungarica]KAI9639212.1 hypothetical protein MKK02DRAFT_29318 [Dioszegia hungarica]
MKHLPLEIWSRIIYDLRVPLPLPLSRPHRSALAQGNLVRAALVSKAFYAIVLPLLYRSILTDDLPKLLHGIADLSAAQSPVRYTVHLYIEYRRKSTDPGVLPRIEKLGWTEAEEFGLRKAQCKDEVERLSDCLERLDAAGIDKALPRLQALAVASIYETLDSAWTDYKKHLSPSSRTLRNCAKLFHTILAGSTLQHFGSNDPDGPFSLPQLTDLPLHIGSYSLTLHIGGGAAADVRKAISSTLSAETAMNLEFYCSSLGMEPEGAAGLPSSPFACSRTWMTKGGNGIRSNSSSPRIPRPVWLADARRPPEGVAAQSWEERRGYDAQKVVMRSGGTIWEGGQRLDICGGDRWRWRDGIRVDEDTGTWIRGSGARVSEDIDIGNPLSPSPISAKGPLATGPTYPASSSLNHHLRRAPIDDATHLLTVRRLELEDACAESWGWIAEDGEGLARAGAAPRRTRVHGWSRSSSPDGWLLSLYSAKSRSARHYRGYLSTTARQRTNRRLAQSRPRERLIHHLESPIQVTLGRSDVAIAPLTSLIFAPSLARTATSERQTRHRTPRTFSQIITASLSLAR